MRISLVVAALIAFAACDSEIGLEIYQDQIETALREYGSGDTLDPYTQDVVVFEDRTTGERTAFHTAIPQFVCDLNEGELSCEMGNSVLVCAEHGHSFPGSFEWNYCPTHGVRLLTIVLSGGASKPAFYGYGRTVEQAAEQCRQLGGSASTDTTRAVDGSLQMRCEPTGSQ